jgi:hypothetical protein
MNLPEDIEIACDEALSRPTARKKPQQKVTFAHALLAAILLLVVQHLSGPLFKAMGIDESGTFAVEGKEAAKRPVPPPAGEAQSSGKF